MHISTIAVRPEWRRGIGELLLVAMLELAVELGGNLATLEVRGSNVAAQALYQKYGFAKVGLRPRYYSDRGEDALIMTTKHLTSVVFQSGFQRLKVVPDQIDKGNRIRYNKLDGASVYRYLPLAQQVRQDSGSESRIGIMRGV